MPLYEYQCDACGAQFELIRKFADPPVDVCPTCGAGGVRKLLSSPAFQFKGSGWYVTDYARKSGEPTAGSKSAAESKDAGKSDSSKDSAKADAAPVAKSEPSADKPAATAPAASPSKDTSRD